METLLSPFRRTPPTVKMFANQSEESSDTTSQTSSSGEPVGQSPRESKSKIPPVRYVGPEGINNGQNLFEPVETDEIPTKTAFDADQKHSMPRYDAPGIGTPVRELFGYSTPPQHGNRTNDMSYRRSQLPKIEYIRTTKLSFDNFDEFKDSVRKVGYTRQWPTKFYKPTQKDLSVLWTEDSTESYDESLCRREAYLLLNNAIPKELKYIVRRVPEGDTIGMWRTIVTRFLRVSSADLTQQKLEFFRMNTTSLKLWPDEFIALVAQKSANLQLVGVEITEQDEISVVVNGLCQKFEWLKNHERINPTKTFDEIAVKIIQFAADHKYLKKSGVSSSTPKGGSLLYAADKSPKPECRGWKTPQGCRFGDKCKYRHVGQTAKKESVLTVQPHQKKTYGEWKKSATCHHCKKVGHIKPDCPEKPAGGFQKGDPAQKDKSASDESWSLMAAANQTTARERWLFDSGAYCHITNDFNDLIDPVPVPVGENTLTIGNNDTMQPTYVGQVKICSVTLQRVYLCQDCPIKLLSEGVFMTKGFDVVKRNSTKSVQVVAPDQTVVLQGSFSDGAFYLTQARLHTQNGSNMCACVIEKSPKRSVLVAYDKEKLEDYHQVTGHINFPECRRMLSMDESKQGDPVCEACELSKSRVIPRPKEASTRSARPIYRLFVDLSGRKRASLAGYRHFMLVTDDYSRKKWTHWLATKKATQVLTGLKEIILRVEREKAPLKVAKIRTDGGKEFHGEVKQWLREQGIEHEESAPYSQHQNGVVERNIGFVDENARAMMLHAGSPTYDWPYAVSHAVYLHNFAPTKAHGVATPMAPNEVYQGQTVKLLLNAVFGCLGFAKVFVRGKQEPKARKVICLGYNDHSRAFYVRDVSSFKNSLREYLARSVKWEKRVFPYRNEMVPRPTPPVMTHEDVREQKKIDAMRVKELEHEVLQPVQDAKGQGDVDETEQDESFDHLDEVLQSPDDLKHSHSPRQTCSDVTTDEDEDPEDRALFEDFDMSSESSVLSSSLPIPPDLPEHYRVRRNSERLEARDASQKSLQQIVNEKEGGTGGNFGTSKYMYLAANTLDPTTQKQAYSAYDVDDWKEAERKEIESCITLGTWKIVRRDPSMFVLGSRFLYKRKKDPNGVITKRKARFIVQGHRMRPELDYTETFASTVHLQSVRVVLWIATFYRMAMCKFDISTFFLYGKIKETVFIQQPQGYEQEDPKSHVCQLLKTLYGTKQAMREANRTLREALVEIGVHQLVMDEHVYFLRRGDSVLILCVFVDDILAVATSSTVIEWFRGNLSKKFEITSS